VEATVIAVELQKLFRRPRTWAALVLLIALPTLVAVFLATTGVAPRPGQGPAFLSAVLHNGQLFSVAALAIVLPLFLPISIAVIAGEAIAGEAQGGTLRYLLARPVGRTRLLIAKLVAIFTFIAVAVLLVAGTGFIVGSFLFGNEPIAASTFSGSSLTPQQVLIRSALAIVYVMLSMLGIAATALFLSTLTDSPLSATLGGLALLIGSSLLLTLDAARSVKPYLPTRYWLSFVDLFRDPILWRNVERGVSLQAVYVVILLAAAWANFASKDIKS
jgi:ABC-2 type transport system permease protein